MSIHIRWCIRRDLPSLLAIAEKCGINWTEEDFLEEMRERNVICMVAELQDDGTFPVVGYMIYRLQKSYLELITMAVYPDEQRKGIGTQMVQKLISKLSSLRRNLITLSVRESNLAAQLFLRKNGFLARKVLRGYFDGPDEDGYLFRYRLNDAPVEEVVDNDVIEF